ncbi:MAG: hypothetical protein HY815_32475 [Candidatus Riflebacteria bacterium]|nr:hypothetical protein [Candidatus Riflebacteria bacterium]
MSGESSPEAVPRPAISTVFPLFVIQDWSAELGVRACTPEMSCWIHHEVLEGLTSLTAVERGKPLRLADFAVLPGERRTRHSEVSPVRLPGVER